MSGNYTHNKVIGGIYYGDYDTHRTLFAGPDPADPSRVLIRRLVKISDSTYCYEESRISQAKDQQPTVHTSLMRLKG